MKKGMVSNVSPSAIDSQDYGDEEAKRGEQLQEIAEVGEEGVTDPSAHTTSTQLKDTSKFNNKRPPGLIPEKSTASTTSNRRPAGLTVDTTKGKNVGVLNKNVADFSPMTPSKTIGVRFQAQNKGYVNLDALKSPLLPGMSYTPSSHGQSYLKPPQMNEISEF